MKKFDLTIDEKQRELLVFALNNLADQTSEVTDLREMLEDLADKIHNDLTA